MSDQVQADRAFDEAAAVYAQGAQDRAMALCETILRTAPDHVEALNLLGVILQNLDRTLESLPLLSRAAELDPEFPDVFANLARGFRALGEEAKAEAAASRAVELDPGLEEGWLHLGLSQFGQKRYTGGMETLRAAVAHLPDAVGLHAAMGFAAIDRDDAPAAVAAWREILRLQPDRVAAMINLGTALCMLDACEDALPYHARALALAPDLEASVTAYAGTLQGCHKSEELVAFCRAELVKRPGQIDLLKGLVQGLSWLGRFDEARALCAAAGPASADPGWFQLHTVNITQGAPAPDVVAGYRTRLWDESLPAAGRIAAGYALGKALDRSAKGEDAMAAFLEANRLEMAENEATGNRFNLGELQAFVAHARATYTPALWPQVQTLGNPSTLPVFIAGMPRSGTTLAEQIAASHSQVFGAGELKDLPRMIARLNAGGGTASPLAWDRDLVRRETAAHLDALRALGGTAAMVIDKLPDNIQILGQIRALYPNAPIVICRRDLRDVCLSCFTTQFGERIPWANDLLQCAQRAIEIEELTNFWVAALPGPILELRYETLVANLEAESRRLIAFLGLDWEPACLNFHKTERTVVTASVWQVRQPLYNSSVGRWLPYAAHLEPMLKLLRWHVPPAPGNPAS